MIERPGFELLDHSGRAVTIDSFKGRRCLVFFGFTNCKVVCPRALTRLSEVLERLGSDGKDIQGLYISVDPERDTPARLAQFLKLHPRFVGLTGTTDQAAAARESFGVFIRRRANPNASGGYDVPHTALTYLLNPDGVYENHWLDSAPVEELVTELLPGQPSSPTHLNQQPTTRSCCGH